MCYTFYIASKVCVLPLKNHSCTISVLVHNPYLKFFLIQTPKFFNEIVKFTSQIAWKQILTTFLKLVRELLDVEIIANARF